MKRSQNATIKARGNTEPSPKSTKIRSKNLLMTIPKDYFTRQQVLIDYLEHFKTFQYMIICEHDGPTNEHRHLYCQFNNTTTLDRTSLLNLHTDECYGSAQQNIDYASGKDDKHRKLNVKSTKIYENGLPCERGRCSINVEEAIHMTEDQILKMPAVMHSTIRKIQADHAARPLKFTESYKPDVEVIYIYGSSDVGKTKWIYDYFKKMGDDEPLSEKIKFDGKYWTGFTEGIEYGIYDEWRDNHMKPTEFLNLIDYYVQKMRVLYGYKNNFYKHIFITTTQPIDEIYNGSHENPLQWYKRITKIINIETGEEINGREAYQNLCKNIHIVSHDKEQKRDDGIQVKVPVVAYDNIQWM